MKTSYFWGGLLTIAAALQASALEAAPLNGQGDNQRSDLGYYYVITGGKIPPGETVNGLGASGGSMRFLLDDPVWGHPTGSWRKDFWFAETAGLALTLKNGSAIVYDNNGLEDGTYDDFYDATGLAASDSKPGLYRGYSMSNNFDWIYAGFFRVTEEITFDTIIGYYDENNGFDSSSPQIKFNMNIFSAVQDDPDGNPDSWMPGVVSFEGDIFSSNNVAGSFSATYSGVDRIFGDDQGNATDEIWRLAYTLDSPFTLQPGVYFFSHDAEIVPEPSTYALSLGALAAIGVCVCRRRRAVGV